MRVVRVILVLLAAWLVYTVLGDLTTMLVKAQVNCQRSVAEAQ